MNYKEEITINQVILLGRICNDIELKQTQNNKSYTRFSLAVNRKGKDAGSDFISCIAWNKTAEFLTKYMKKGSQICISGRLQTGQYDDKDGKRIYTTDVIVEEVDFADYDFDLEAIDLLTSSRLYDYIQYSHGGEAEITFD